MSPSESTVQSLTRSISLKCCQASTTVVSVTPSSLHLNFIFTTTAFLKYSSVCIKRLLLLSCSTQYSLRPSQPLQALKCIVSVLQPETCDNSRIEIKHVSSNFSLAQDSLDINYLDKEITATCDSAFTSSHSSNF